MGSFGEEFKTTHYRFFIESVELWLCGRPVNEVVSHLKILVIDFFILVYIISDESWSLGDYRSSFLSNNFEKSRN